MILEPTAVGWQRGDGWWDKQVDTLVKGLYADRVAIDYLPDASAKKEGFGQKGGFAIALALNHSMIEDWVRLIARHVAAWFDTKSTDQRHIRFIVDVPGSERRLEVECSGANFELHDVERSMRALIESAMSGPERRPLRPDIRLVFLAANPWGSSPLSLGREYQHIRSALERSPRWPRLDLRPYWCVRPHEVSERLLEHNPRVVHFCGHGSERGELIFEGRNREPQPATAGAVADLFAQLRGIQCVVLSACHTDIQAKAISPHVDWVVGMRGAVPSELALEFSASFYRALAHGYSVPESVGLACAHTRLAEFDSTLFPVLHRRTGVDPNKPLLG
ncbi:hypothetical protein PPSIR1_20929 [Plesiocystis pacifica SIR-1]|uniref:CHAT domain-containing protein n=1 Tax=Plesiocystis pacifica SIR-1 TaxID=391625 RepID=A6G3C5_9BACT|nr:hypothetical protein PPSIR1_20929 [Plesiocystis pacifica SIR-1]